MEGQESSASVGACGDLGNPFGPASTSEMAAASEVLPSVQPQPPIPGTLTETPRQGESQQVSDADSHEHGRSRASIFEESAEDTNASHMANVYMTARVAAVSGDGEVALGLIPQTPSCRAAPAPAADRSSKRRTDSSSLDERSKLPTVRVHVNQAKIAAMLGAASDDEDRPERVGVVMWMVSASGEPLGPVAEWPARKGLSPLWNSARSVVQSSASSDGSPARLRIELWGVMDDGSKCLLAGPVEFPSAKLPMKPTSIAMHKWDSAQVAKTVTKMQFVARNTVPPANIALHALPPLGGLPFVPKRMTVFFVRHGESRLVVNL